MYLCPFVPRLRSHTPDSSGKPAGCAAPEDLERIDAIGVRRDRHDGDDATPEALRALPEVARFIQWVQDKPIDFNPPTRRSRSKGQL